MMNFNSIRWRLPLSYAAIALLAALALGSVMLLVLNKYYTSLERDYLMGNAQSIQPIVEQALKTHSSTKALQDQLTALAFLSQTQIRVLDQAGQPLADSGALNPKQMVALSSAPEGVVFNLVVASPDGGSKPLMLFTRKVDMTPGVAPIPFAEGMQIDTKDLPPPADTFFSVSASPFGYGFAAKPSSTSERSSSQVVSLPLADSLGTLEISNGPAYGADILDSVTLAWLIASVIAITLAALAGWFASREVTQPVLALTDATRRMEQGNLSVRAHLPGAQQAREFQALAHSFNNMAQRVEDTVSTLRAFVSDAAHELNTPLTALKTNLELAANETDAAQKGVFLARALEQNRRLELLTGGLLDLSRIPYGHDVEAAQSALETVDLRQLAAETGERFASRAEQAERSFGLHLPEGEIALPGNALQLQRALDNLLENALKFTPPGGEISLHLREQKDGQPILTVSDTGIGILPEDLPHIFERFHRGRNSAEFPGNGLGLAIVKAIVAAHGGQVSVESEGWEQGSTFSIVLPKV
jgi:signal transduction histidine kinase